MKVLVYEASFIPDVLKENLLDKNVYFVFPSDVVATSWSEWCVKNSEISGVKAVAQNRFVPWDKFKTNFIDSNEKDKTAIPSILRKIFVQHVIEQNKKSNKSGNPLFKSIINPEFADNADSFSDWLANNLKALKQWHKHFVELQKTGANIDDEDNDYLFLYNEYCSFLKKNNMFEPSWVDSKFVETQKKFIIFYPEQLEDFNDYVECFSETDSIIAVKLPEQATEIPEVRVFPDARTELRRVALYVRYLLTEKNVSWNDIAISVPGIKHYKPYIQREFEKYAIPCVIRVGNSYTVNNAGRIFENIRECKLNNFSYDSVRSLLLNCYIPWKDKDINENLIREGNRLHCVCGFEEKPGEILDIWNATLSKIPEDERELTFYKILKDDINRICNSKTFSQIRDGWFTFKNHFLKEDEFTIEANNILSRCIEELEALISIEKDFIIPLELNVTSPFDFFINELNTKSYRPQEKIKGVSIFDYKLVACSAYKYHIVMNCSQSNLSIPYRPLSFLNNEKRKQLGIFDEDVASSAFIRLYAKNICKSDSQNYTIFTCSEESFEGFAIPHNFFAISKADDCLFETLDKNDFIKAEEKLFMKDEIPFAISTKQQNEFLKWKNAADYNNNSEYVVDSSVQEKIKFALSDNRSKKLDSQFDGKMIISQSDMAKFFPCPRKWLLNDILKLKDDSLEINLLQPYDIGNINHKILEIVFLYFKKNNLLIPAIQEDESFGKDEELVRKVVSDAVEKAINSYEMNFKDSYLVLAVLESQKSKFEEGIIKFLRSFCNVEKGFGGKKIYALEQWYSSLAENQEFGFTGRIDSILADDEGKLSVIDYKNTLSGISSKQYIVDQLGKLEKFQIAMYASLIKSCEAKSVEIENALLCAIKNYELKKVIANSKRGNCVSEEEFEKTIDAFNLYAQTFVEKVKSGKFEPVMNKGSIYEDLDVFTECKSCNFKSVCRTTYSVAGHQLKKIGK